MVWRITSHHHFLSDQCLSTKSTEMKNGFRKWFYTIFFNLILMLISGLGFSQINLTGKVVDRISQTPVPLVNIAIPGTYYGTITNNNGNFSVTIPSKYSNKELVFSCIGFKSDTIPLSLAQSGLIIKLEKKVNELSEIIVMPKNTLYKILKQAYDKIPENYPVSPTYYKGFYRETIKDENEKYISFGEALLESVRGSVNLRNDKGQVKILKSRGGYLPGRDSITNIHFYGGVFLSTKDFVQNRNSFINPASFNGYQYTVQKTGHYYKINFSTINEKDRMTGYFLLDTLTLAYTEAKYHYERNENKIRYQRLDAESYYKFISINNKYFLKYRYYKSKGFDKFKRKELFHFVEYLATEIIPNSTEKIPEKEQVNYFDTFINKIPDYSDNYWEGITIVESDSLLRKSQLTQKEIDSIQDRTKNFTNKKKLIAIISKLSFKYGITYSSPKIIPGTYEFKLPSIDQIFTREFTDAKTWSMNTSIGYFFSPHFAVTYSDESSIVKNNVFRDKVLGVEFKEKMNSFGNPNYLSLKAGVGQATSLLEIGSFQNQETIKWGKKKLDARKITAFAGSRSWIFKPSIGLSRHLKGKSSLFIDFSYALDFSSKEIVLLKEKSGLFRKSAIEDISEIDMQLYRNGNLIDKTDIKPPKWNITVGINLLR